MIVNRSRLPRLLQDDFHVIMFDNRGTGRSSRHGWFYSMRELADDAAAVLDAVGVARAHVFGISFGGMVALELALQHPQRVQRLALGATFAGFRTARRGTCLSARTRARDGRSAARAFQSVAD